MREIKFRAWDKKENKWLLGYEYPSLGGFSMFGEVMMMGEYAALISHRLNDLENIVLMQYTGLKDKNGKEIYEGDIIERWSYTSETLGRQDVERFPVKYFGDTGYPAFDLEGNESDANGLSELNDSGEWEYEVIGNIYENPDLLK